MSSRAEPVPAADLLAALEAEHRRLRELLTGKNEAAMAQRPPSGKWSALENVRHLLFAEELHLGQFLPPGQQFSPLGLPPLGMQGQQRFQVMRGGQPSRVAEVLDAWRAAHASIRQHLQHDTPQVRKELDRNLRHLRAHTRIVERLLRATGGPAPATQRRAPESGE